MSIVETPVQSHTETVSVHCPYYSNRAHFPCNVEGRQKISLSLSRLLSLLPLPLPSLPYSLLSLSLASLALMPCLTCAQAVSENYGPTAGLPKSIYMSTGPHSTHLSRDRGRHASEPLPQSWTTPGGRRTRQREVGRARVEVTQLSMKWRVVNRKRL